MAARVNARLRKMTRETTDIFFAEYLDLFKLARYTPATGFTNRDIVMVGYADDSGKLIHQKSRPYASVKRNVFGRVFSGKSFGFLSVGRVFQIIGATCEKARPRTLHT